MRIGLFLTLLLPLASSAQAEISLKQKADSLLKIAIATTRNPDSTVKILAAVEQ
ncbi:MAG: hypothetical protein H6536_05240 [Bacteroidales bacterium]|nr:hypothetical protein [Bacteroidales bacterium]